MERTADFKRLKTIFQENFIGPDELSSISKYLPLDIPRDIPGVNYSDELLEEKSKDGYLLVLTVPQLISGKPINIFNLRELFGMNPDESEPCFYNQDWYLNEDFIQAELSLEWKLIKKSVYTDSRAVDPKVLEKKISFPSALLCTYTFFVYYFLANETLWEYDFIWCSDNDHNGDQIYVGKYSDIDGVNKSGYSIHRHLALRDCYAAIDCN